MFAKIKRIIIILLISIPSIIIFLVLLGFLYTYIDSKFFGFRIDEKLNDLYGYIFNNKYKENIIINNSYSSRRYGYMYYYIYKSNIICVTEIKQFDNINLKEIKIKNYNLVGEKKEYPHTSISGISRLEPHLIMGYYPDSKRTQNVNIYMENKIENLAQNEKYMYIKFIGDVFAISSTDEYPDLKFVLTEQMNPIMELLILKDKGKDKKEDKTLIILKYKGKDIGNSENIEDDVSLLDLINVDG